MYVNFIGSLVRKDELQFSQNGQPYVRFSIVRNYSRKLDDGSYEETGSFFENFVLFGKRALCFAQSDLPNGTRLAINGFTRCRLKEAYVNKDGIQVPEENIEEIVIDNIAVLLDYKQTVNVDKADYSSIEKGAPAANTAAAPQQKKSATKTKAQSKSSQKSAAKKAEEPVNMDEIFSTDNTNSLSENDVDIFGEDSNNSTLNEVSNSDVSDNIFDNDSSDNIFSNSDDDIDIFAGNDDFSSSGGSEDDWDIFED